MQEAYLGEEARYEHEDSRALATARPCRRPTPFFSCRDLHAYYGESYIVQGVSFSTSTRARSWRCSAATAPARPRRCARSPAPRRRSCTRGEIWLDGVKLHGKPNYFAAQAGIQLVQEDRRIIPGLTVEENLQLAQIAGSVGWSFERIYELFPRLAERRKQEGVTLSGGEQQMLAIARALARDLKLLLLDEPYEGLAPVIVQEIEQDRSTRSRPPASPPSSSSRTPSPRWNLPTAR